MFFPEDSPQLAQLIHMLDPWEIKVDLLREAYNAFASRQITELAYLLRVARIIEQYR